MVDTDFYNPFQGTEILVPKALHDSVKEYCQKAEGSSGSVDKRPFLRMVDMWFLSVCMAVRNNLEPIEKGKKGKSAVEINRGAIFANEPDMVRNLMLIAIKVSDDMQIVKQPNKMMDLANGLAGAGMPKVIEMLKEGDGEAIWNLSEAICDLLEKNT